MTAGMRRFRPPGSGSPIEVFRHPVHPALAHLPVGAWVCSLMFDIASQVVRNPAFLVLASRWLIAIGLLGAVAAACAGFVDLAAIRGETAAFRTACAHMLLNVLLVFAYTANFALRYHSHPAGAPIGAGVLALSVVSALTLGVSGYLGGKLTYGYGAGVAASASPAGHDLGTAAHPAERPVPRHRADRPLPLRSSSADAQDRQHHENDRGDREKAMSDNS